MRLKRRNLFLLVAVFYIFYVTNSMMQMVFPPFWSIIPLGVVLCCFALYPGLLIKDAAALSCLAYAGCLLLWPVFFHPLSGFSYGNGELDTALIETAFILPAVVISSVLFKLRDDKALRVVAVASSLSLFVSLLYHIPFVVTDNSIARMVSAKEAYQGQNLLPGFWNYPMLHIVAVCLPVYWGLTRETKSWRRFFYALMILMLIVFGVQTSIATVFVYLLIAFFLLFNYEISKTRYPLYLFVGELILLAFLVGKLPDITDSLLSYYENTDMVEKLEDFKNLIEGNSDANGTVSRRAEYQGDSLEAFLDNPFIGVQYEGGGHSTFLSRLAALGFFGFVPFLGLLLTQALRWFRRVPSSRRIYYLISMLGVFILLFTKNVFGREGWLFFSVLLPAFFIQQIPEPKKKK